MVPENKSLSATVHTVRSTGTNLEVFVCWEDVRQMDHLMGAPLRCHYYTAYLFHLWVVRWTHTVQVASNLTASNHTY